MAIHSSNFGVTRLTKEDSRKFIQQVKYGRPNQAAAASLKNGQKLLREISTQGFAKVKSKASR
jgi:hypothetical protein